MEVDGDATMKEAMEFGMFFSLYIVSAVLSRPEPANNAFNVLMAPANMPKYPMKVAPRNLKARIQWHHRKAQGCGCSFFRFKPCLWHQIRACAMQLSLDGKKF